VNYGKTGLSLSSMNTPDVKVLISDKSNRLLATGTIDEFDEFKRI
jgi:hypothetical protein